MRHAARAGSRRDSPPLSPPSPRSPHVPRCGAASRRRSLEPFPAGRRDGARGHLRGGMRGGWQEVGRSNFGLTLDVGHMLVAGENPAQSVAMVGRAGRLFGVQLNDGHGRGEDGLMLGSVHEAMALELVLWLIRTRYDGHIYFDTFPRNEDPVREAEYNIRRFKALWARAERLLAAGIEGCMARHDAMAALELLEQVP